MPSQQWNLPHLPDHVQRRIVNAALGGSYRRIRITPSEVCVTISLFFTNILPILYDTAQLIGNNSIISPYLILQMLHSLGEEETEETIYIALKATSFTNTFVNDMEQLFQQRLDAFTQRGSNFTLLSVTALDLDVTRYNNIPFHIGHN